MPDEYSAFSRTLTSPAEDGFAITPHDTNDLAAATKAIYVGGAGAVSLVTVRGTTLTFGGLAAGSILPVRATRVRSTGTTATLLVGLV